MNLLVAGETQIIHKLTDSFLNQNQKRAHQRESQEIVDVIQSDPPAINSVFKDSAENRNSVMKYSRID